jgi:hypothetical protein
MKKYKGIELSNENHDTVLKFPEPQRLQAAQALADAVEKSKAEQRIIAVKPGKKTGVVCLYGLGRYPVSLYKEQWLRLKVEGIPAIDAFFAKEDN